MRCSFFITRRGFWGRISSEAVKIGMIHRREATDTRLRYILTRGQGLRASSRSGRISLDWISTGLGPWFWGFLGSSSLRQQIRRTETELTFNDWSGLNLRSGRAELNTLLGRGNRTSFRGCRIEARGVETEWIFSCLRTLRISCRVKMEPIRGKPRVLWRRISFQGDSSSNGNYCISLAFLSRTVRAYRNSTCRGSKLLFGLSVSRVIWGYSSPHPNKWISPQSQNARSQRDCRQRVTTGVKW